MDIGMSKYYKVKLEGLCEGSDLHSFYNDDPTMVNMFGDIIIETRINGTESGYYEIVSGIRIPVIYPAAFYSTCVPSIPTSAYRARFNKNDIIASTMTVEDYIKKNNNEEFIKDLNSFIDESKRMKKRIERNNIKRLIKRIF